MEEWEGRGGGKGTNVCHEPLSLWRFSLPTLSEVQVNVRTACAQDNAPRNLSRQVKPAIRKVRGCIQGAQCDVDTACCTML